MMDKKTIFAALAALVGLGWLFRKGDTSTAATIPGYTKPLPANTAATGANPVIIVATGNGSATADTTVSNPAPTARAGTVASFGAGTSSAPQTTSAEEAEAAAAHAAFRAGQPAPAGWRYTPMGPVRI